MNPRLLAKGIEMLGDAARPRGEEARRILCPFAEYTDGVLFGITPALFEGMQNVRAALQADGPEGVSWMKHLDLDARAFMHIAHAATSDCSGITPLGCGDFKQIDVFANDEVLSEPASVLFILRIGCDDLKIIADDDASGARVEACMEYNDLGRAIIEADAMDDVMVREAVQKCFVGQAQPKTKKQQAPRP